MHWSLRIFADDKEQIVKYVENRYSQSLAPIQFVASEKSWKQKAEIWNRQQKSQWVTFHGMEHRWAAPSGHLLGHLRSLRLITTNFQLYLDKIVKKLSMHPQLKGAYDKHKLQIQPLCQHTAQEGAGGRESREIITSWNSPQASVGVTAKTERMRYGEIWKKGRGHLPRCLRKRGVGHALDYLDGQ